MEGFASPVLLADPGDGSGRLFVLDQVGLVRVMEDGALLEEPFLDLRDRLVDLSEVYDERGLLGLAFHPDFASNRRFFVYYSAPCAGLALRWGPHQPDLRIYRLLY
jgi:glucose/arabinose dehydrogenase